MQPRRSLTGQPVSGLWSGIGLPPPGTANPSLPVGPAFAYPLRNARVIRRSEVLRGGGASPVPLWTRPEGRARGP